MDKFPEPTITDQDIDLFIEWLSAQENIGKKPIALTVDALIKLKNDRQTLVQTLMNQETENADV
jgi:hypothetical protein